MTAPDHVFFVHLQKTAGTTLRQRLAAAFGDAALYPAAVDGDATGLTFLVDEMQRRVADRADEVRIVFGHYPLCVRELLPWPVRTATMLREPVERTLSYLRHHRETTPADADRSLEQIYEDPLRFHGLAHNHMTKMLSLTVDEMTSDMLTRVEFTPDRLDRAKAALADVDVVGVSEEFEAFCDDLRHTFGWPLADTPRYANRSAPVEVSDSFRRRIAVDNSADIELYGHALHRLAQPRTRGHRRGVAPRA